MGELDVKNQVPVYWKSTLEDVEETLKLVKRGTVKILTTSAGGRPIYQVEYGKSNVKMGQANLASALGAFDIKYFADKTGEDYVPTLFLDGCIHGGEFEGTVAILNLIKLMETGTDYNGDAYPELLDLMNRLHLILVPVSNPDGRSRIPFDTFVGRTFHDFRYYAQGTWKDGSLCGWPECKKVHPIKEKAGFLGAYFNDDGINMMHEDYFGDASKETRALFDICRKEAPDFSVLLHGGTNATNCFVHYNYVAQQAYDEAMVVTRQVKERCDEEGLLFQILENCEFGDGFMLCAAMHHLCGGVSIVYESNQGLVDGGNVAYTYDEIYKSHFVMFEEVAKHLLAKYQKQ